MVSRATRSRRGLLLRREDLRDAVGGRDCERLIASGLSLVGFGEIMWCGGRKKRIGCLTKEEVLRGTDPNSFVAKEGDTVVILHVESGVEGEDAKEEEGRNVYCVRGGRGREGGRL